VLAQVKGIAQKRRVGLARVLDAEVEPEVQARHDKHGGHRYLPPVEPLEESHGERLYKVKLHALLFLGEGASAQNQRRQQRSAENYADHPFPPKHDPPPSLLAYAPSVLAHAGTPIYCDVLTRLTPSMVS
jgi:hypothetical protein